MSRPQRKQKNASEVYVKKHKIYTWITLTTYLVCIYINIYRERERDDGLGGVWVDGESE